MQLKMPGSIAATPIALAVIWFGSLSWQATAAAAESADSGRITIEQNPDTLTTNVLIEAQDGKVSWADLWAGLAQAKGYDADALADVPRRKSFDLNRRHTRLLLALMNAVSEASGIRFSIVPPEKIVPPEGVGAEPKLRVTLDRRAMVASKRRFEKMLRLAASDRLTGDRPAPNYGLAWPDDERPRAGQASVVILHGLGSTPEKHGSLAADLRRAGLRVGEFAYPGDEPLDDSAKLFSRELKRFHRDHPDVRLRMVTLSMGGLVARRALEDPALDPGNVEQLLMIGAPNHGSALAYCGFGLQIWQFLDDPKARSFAERFYHTVEDGLCEASDDLRPDSPFIKELNSLARNPRLRYTLLLGSGAMFSQQTIDQLRDRVEKAEKSHRFLQFLGPKIDRVLADGDELIQGKGDGAVAIERGRLEGVADTMVIDFDHLSMGRQPQTDGERKLREEVLKRCGGHE